MVFPSASKTKKNVGPVTFLELEESGLIDSAVKAGGRIALFLPSSESKTSLQMESGLMKLNVVERTNLASVNEGLIMGTSYFVTPLCHEWEGFSDEHDNLEMNAHTFYGICESLFHLDQGFVCSSSCNLETMTDGNFTSFYLLQPSYHGPMLLRRLASSEEILPIPSQLKKPIVAEEIMNSIQASLSKIEFRDYNPLEHERGLYPQLNKLVEEILELGPLPTEVDMTPKVEDTLNEKYSTPGKPSATVVMFEKENANRDENTLSSISDEWERILIVDGMDDSFSAGSISESTALSSLPTHEKSLDERTSRILERLEAPKSEPYISDSGHTKKLLLPSDPSPIQPLRPNFQRSKRKLR
ncbi:hypothetical protein HPP92_021579 [Vanilla planifolia]|uniref:Uncharacterized protein n=1 Tax=Vanilla planifolia TaxID=51239 RepID=A0A835Q1E0_VANPL|nr:hypothetical protein HPP92_021579 [Vanilla planifolia]